MQFALITPSSILSNNGKYSLNNNKHFHTLRVHPIQSNLIRNHLIPSHLTEQAKASSKKIASQNASTLQILLYGFISSNFIHLLFTFILWKSSLNTAKVLLYLVTESVAISLAWVLKGMANKGDDLSQSGLTA